LQAALLGSFLAVVMNPQLRHLHATFPSFLKSRTFLDVLLRAQGSVLHGIFGLGDVLNRSAISAKLLRGRRLQTLDTCWYARDFRPLRRL
jgi:hypothetical protein